MQVQTEQVKKSLVEQIDHSDVQKAEEVTAIFNATSAAWQAAQEEWKTDFEMVMNKQWREDVEAALMAKGAPAMSFNFITKNINVISGSQRQNRTDIKVFPVDGGDELMAEVLSRGIKWITAKGSSEMTVSDAFKDAVICGVGYLECRPDMTRDPAGDIVIEHPSVFEIMRDPHAKKKDNSDCGFYFRYKDVSRNMLKVNFPEYAKRIGECKSEPLTVPYEQRADDPNKVSDVLTVVEHWYRDVKEYHFIGDDGESRPWKQNEEELEAFLNENPDVVYKGKFKVPIIKLRIVIGGEILVYDGENPYGIDEFPFIPIFGYYHPSMDKWEWKVYGEVRALKDLQRQKNKTHSVMQQIVSAMPNQKWLMEEASVADTESFVKSGNVGGILNYRAGKQAPQQVKPAEIPTSIMNLLTITDNERLIIGANADLLGQISEKGMSGIGMQVRQNQSLKSMQEMFDNLSIAERMLGKLIIKYMSVMFPLDKVRRILGDEYPFPSEQEKTQQKIHIDAIAESLETEVGQMRELMEQMYDENPDQAENMLVEIDQYVREQEGQIQQMIQRMEIQEVAQKTFEDAYRVLPFNMHYDTKVDESENSPTYRLSELNMLTNFVKSGVQLDPDLVTELYLKFSNLPKNIKDQYQQSREQNKQMAAQMQQVQQQNNLELQNIQKLQALAGIGNSLSPKMLKNMVKQVVGIDLEEEGEEDGEENTVSEETTR